MNNSANDKPSVAKGRTYLVAIVLLLAAVAVRFWAWPSRYEIRDVDEPPYLSSSLVLVEGITPGFKPSPAGPQIWLGWMFAQLRVLEDFIHPDPALQHVPLQIRPF